jgi:hypothetical protein
MQTYAGSRYSRAILDLDTRKYRYIDKVVLVLNWLATRMKAYRGMKLQPHHT